MAEEKNAQAALDRASWPGQYNLSVEHDPDDLWDDSRVILNIGPTHPAMHGAFRMMAKINGEIIRKQTQKAI